MKKVSFFIDVNMNNYIDINYNYYKIVIFFNNYNLSGTTFINSVQLCYYYSNTFPRSASAAMELIANDYIVEDDKEYYDVEDDMVRFLSNEDIYLSFENAINEAINIISKKRPNYFKHTPTIDEFLEFVYKKLEV